MSDELQQFEIVMDQLRKAGAAEGISAGALTEIRARFDEVVRSKNEYLISALDGQRRALSELGDAVQSTIATIEYYVANFPLEPLRNVRGRLGKGSAPSSSDSPIVLKQNTTASGRTLAAAEDSVKINPGDLKLIDVQSQELDALCRVSHSEVGHFLKYGRPELDGGLRAVVDTIINRCAHLKYPDGIQAVVDQPYQFSAINNLGSWAHLPAAEQLTIEIVSDHVRRRSEGAPSTIGGATHFLNPYYSSEAAMASWGRYVVDNPVAKFGREQAHDIHYHGYAPNVSLPQPYIILHLDKRFAFSGQGLPLNVGSQDGFRSLLVKNCLDQWEYFKRGTVSEDSDPYYMRVGDFWEILNIPYNGRTKILNEATQTYKNPPWSAAFISFVVSKSSGKSRGFKYAQAHCHYVQDFISGRSDALYAAEHPDHYSPQPGDIIHYGRDAAASYSFSEARARYLADSFYASHSDVVVEVNASQRIAKTIGGNVIQSVGMKSVPLTAHGKLQMRNEQNVDLPWIAILRAIK